MTTKTIASVGLALILTALTITTVEARGFICGATQMAHYGITDPKYRLALNWSGMQHVSAQPGAVVVQRRNGRALGGGPGGHVSRIVEMKGQCRAIVADDRGQYERDICSRLVAYVMPGGGTGGMTAALTDMPRARHRSKHAGRIQLASAPDRHSTQ